MSDLSRLRARWVRLEKRIATLDQQVADSDDDGERAELEIKIIAAQAKLDLTIQQTATEERRLFDANSMLRFTNL